MSGIELFWRLPTHGDGHHLGRADRGDWTPTTVQHVAHGAGADDGFRYIDYISGVARTADLAGFHGALVPTGRGTEEPWVVSAALARETRRLRFLIAFQPAYLQPAYAAQMGASLQRISGDRVDWNIITGASAIEQRATGDFMPHDERYERTAEWMEVVDGYWTGDAFDHHGKRYRIEQGGLKAPLNREQRPTYYFSGASEAAQHVAVRHADVFLMWGEPLAQTRAFIEPVRQRAEAAGRRLRFGARFDVIARATEEEAWAAARRIYDGIDAAVIAKAQQQKGGKAGRDGAFGGADRQAALRTGTGFEDLILGPNVWAGLGLARGGPSCAFVGSYANVAERILEYHAAGVSSFILAGTPHLEEGLRVGQEVLPLVRRALRQPAPAPVSQADEQLAPAG